MIGLDTNVLVRYFAQDEPAQARAATRLMESLTRDSPGVVSGIVLAETIWVMEDAYDAGGERVAGIVESLLRTESILVQDAEVVWRALSRYRAGRAGFADCLIERTCAALGCEQTFTFDRHAARDAGMTLIGD